MANVDQDTRRMQRELRDLWRVRNFFQGEVNNRFSDDDFHGPGSEGQKIREVYFQLRIYLELFETRWRESYRRMRKWSRDYAAIPDVFENPLGPQTKAIKRCMTTTNRLTNAQIDSGAETDEAFLSTGNRYENLFDVLDCFLDFLICFQGRMTGWSDRWEGRGPAERFQRIVAVLEDLQAIARAGVSEVQDLMEAINVDKAAGIDELQLRGNRGRQRNAIGSDGTGGMYALNRGLTTVELGGAAEPAEFDPDVETIRDFPALGTEVV